MKILGVVLVSVMGCVAPSNESVSAHAVQPSGAVTFRFRGSLPPEGDTCRHRATWQGAFYYRESLCGTNFHGYVTLPSTPTEGYSSPFNIGDGAPYGMVFTSAGRRPRVMPYVQVSVANDFEDPYWAYPSPSDLFEIASGTSNSNDGFFASFLDPTATAIDNEELIPDPARFSEVCWNALGGCAIVVGDAWAEFNAIDLRFTRSPIAIPVPATEENPFVGSSNTWLDTDHTMMGFTLDIFDASTFATPTCDSWTLFDEGGTESAVEGIVHHDGHGLQHAAYTVTAGSANPARQFIATNVTCTFARPDGARLENTVIWY